MNYSGPRLRRGGKREKRGEIGKMSAREANQAVVSVGG